MDCRMLSRRGGRERPKTKRRQKRNSTSRSGNSKSNSTGSKKNQDCSVDHKRRLIEPSHESLSVRRQCALAGLSRAGFYYQPEPESEENLQLMRLLDEQYMRTPFYGIRRMTAWLETQGHQANHKRVARLLRLMGLEAIYQKPRLSQPGAGHQVYPYLLRGLKIERLNQVWSTDITYIRLRGGFVYLIAISCSLRMLVKAWLVN